MKKNVYKNSWESATHDQTRKKISHEKNFPDDRLGNSQKMAEDDRLGRGHNNHNAPTGVAMPEKVVQIRAKNNQKTLPKKVTFWGN